MAKEENYLDHLLQSVINPDDTEDFGNLNLEDEEEFLKSFDESFSLDEKEMDFVQQFEEELEPKDRTSRDEQENEIKEIKRNEQAIGNEPVEANVVEMDEDLLGNLEKILAADTDNEFKLDNEQNLESKAELEPEPELSLFGKEDTSQEDMSVKAPLGAIKEVASDYEDEDIMALLGDMTETVSLEDSMEQVSIDEFDEMQILNESSEFESLSQPDKGADKKKKGFFSRLFGKKENENDDPNVSNDLGSENLALLQELETIDAKEKEKKKKEKKIKEKKVKEPKEAKPKKEKKIKKPKIVVPEEPTKPLPKVPVVLVFVLCLSIIGLIVLGSNYVGYAGQLKAANEEFSEGNYAIAYEKLSGLNIKEVDKETYSKMYITARASQMYDFYTSFLFIEKYDDALDSLLIGVKRYDSDIETATILGVNTQLDAILLETESTLLERFGITLEQARQLNEIEDSKVYTAKVLEIVKALGLVAKVSK